MWSPSCSYFGATVGQAAAVGHGAHARDCSFVCNVLRYFNFCELHSNDLAPLKDLHDW